MTNWAENTLLSSLTDVDALEALTRARLAEECVPTPGLFEILTWAIDRFMASGQKQAPSRVALEAAWGTRLTEIGAELESEDVQVDIVGTAVGHLRSLYAMRGYQQIITDGAQAMGAATEPERPGVAAATSERMAALVDAVRDRPHAIDGASGLSASLARLEHRMDNPGVRDSFGLGLHHVDEHTGGIRPGELGIVMAPWKVGKSWKSLWATLQYFEAGGCSALFTLENVLSDTFDRLACVACGVEYQDYQYGRIDRPTLERLKDWVSTNAKELAERVTVLSPFEEQARTAAAMCRTARLHGADAIVIDQLSHMTSGSATRYRTDREIMASALRELSSDIKRAEAPLKCLLLVQAGRDAAKEAMKTGTMPPDGGFGTSEIEKVADQLYGLLRTEDDLKCGRAKLELLAFRRGEPDSWQLKWAPWKGLIMSMGRLNVTR